MTHTVAAAVILAGGGGTRVGADRNKVYLWLAGRPILAWSLTAFTRMPEIGPVVLVVRPADRPAALALVHGHESLGGVQVVDGGATRQESELCGLQALAGRVETGEVDAVLVHDGARPLVNAALARAVLVMARAHGGAVPGVACADLAVAEGPLPTGQGDGAPDPAGERLVPVASGLIAVQTPQGFRAAPLLAACAAAAEAGFVGTDTASCMERFGALPARWVPGDGSNIKITFPRDLEVAELLVRKREGDHVPNGDAPSRSPATAAATSSPDSTGASKGRRISRVQPGPPSHTVMP